MVREHGEKNMVGLNLKAIFSKILKIPPEQINLELNTLTCSEWDSISHNQLITEIESQANISITPEEVSEMLSMKEIIQILITVFGFRHSRHNGDNKDNGSWKLELEK